MNIKINYILFFLLLIIASSCSVFKKQKPYNADKQFKSEEDKLKFTYAFFEGNKNKMLGNYADAAAYYSKCLQLNKKSAASMFELANIYVHQGDMDTAQKLAEEAVSINSENVWYQLLLAALYERNNLPDKSISVYKNIIRQNPSNLDLKLDYANLLSSVKKYEDAINMYNDIENQIGISEEISMEKERLYLNLGQKENAYNEIIRLIEYNPKEARYYGLLAEMYVANELFDKALDVYKKLLEMEPDNGLGHLSISEYYRITGNKDKSFEELKIAFRSKEVNVDLKVKMILTYYVTTKKETVLNSQAYELLEIFEKTHPEEPKAIAVYGDFLIKDEKYEEARNKYKRVTELTKSNYLVWEQLLFIESRLNRFRELYDESKEAMEYFPGQANLYLFLGIAATRLKEYDEAIKSLLTGAELADDNNKMKGQFYTYLGEAYNKKQDHKNSDYYFDMVLALEPDDKYVLNNYSYFLAIRGEKLEKALEMTKKCNELEPDNSTFMDTHAWVLYKMKNFDQAVEIMEKAIEKGGKNSAVIMEHYGDILYHAGRSDKAKEIWKNAVLLGKGSDLLIKKAEEGVFTE
jgi:tetratricopeptide (TPR) repeat protein